MGRCDYAILHSEASGQCSDCGPSSDGRFEFRPAIDSAMPAGARDRLVVTGYAQVGERDRMPIRGEIVKGERPSDSADYRIAEAAACLELYQSIVEMTFVVPAGRPDWSLSRLVLIRSDGGQTRITCSTAASEGFEASGPEEDGQCRVRYSPKAAEVNRQGETDAELTVVDDSGRTTVFRRSFATP